MRPDLAVHAHAQLGLVTRRQAVSSGCTERELRTLTAVGGPWVVVRRGVYLAREVWEAADQSARMALRDRAAHLSMTEAHVMSHDSAARTLGMPLVAVRTPLVHVTRPGFMGTRTEHGVKHHRNRAGAVDSGLSPTVPVTGLERTALDVGREHGIASGVVACDWVLHNGGRTAVFDRELAEMTHWPGITRSRAAFLLADGRAESPAESLARLLVSELGLGAPEPQFPILVDGRLCWCDLRLGCHIFEVDGRLKYVPVAESGVADKSPSEIVWDEKHRQRLIAAEGLGVSRILWSDFWGSARRSALERLAAEYDVTRQRFGDQLPEHLEIVARRFRGTRRRARPLAVL